MRKTSPNSNVDGRKLPPLLILKRKTLAKSEAFQKDIIVRAQEKEWMTEKLMLEWLKIVWGPSPRAFLNQPSMFVLDAFKEHLTDSVKNQLRKMKTELVVIPGGMTSVLQPMDVSINTSFKDRLRQQYLTWTADPAGELTETGKIKRAAPSEVSRWVSAAWKAIPESIIVRSFKKCCISNALDGSEDDILWEDDGQDKDDSDWVTDNDSLMSDEGESDE